MKFLFLFFSLSICCRFSAASEISLYERALENLENERRFYIENYHESKLKKLEKQNYSKIKYSRKIKTILSGINEAERIVKLKMHRIPLNREIGNKKIIFIDPGHGGKEKGANFKKAVIIDGIEKELTENEINFEISLMVKKKLEQKGYIVILSRDSVDDGPSLSARSALCRAIKPDISVSLHLNSSVYAFPIMNRPDTAMPELNYTRVFVWAPSAIDLFIPFYFSIYEKMKAEDTRGKSIRLAGFIAQNLKTHLNLDFYLSTNDETKLETVKKLRQTLVPEKKEEISYEKYPTGLLEKYNNISKELQDDIIDYTGITGQDLHMVREIPAVPSVLVESVFLSCPYEQHKLVFKNRKQQIALSVVEGIEQYFKNVK